MQIIQMQEIKKQFWERIKKLRNERGLSQERLGFISKLHRTYISDIERWEKNVSLENIEKLANALWVDIYHLFHF